MSLVVCIWTPLSDLSRTQRPITFHFPGCDFGGIFLGPAGCIRTHSAAISMTRGTYFGTHELLFGSFLELRARAAEPVGHFGSLSGKRCKKKVTNGGPTGAPRGTFFNTCSIFVLLCGCCCGSLAETGFWVFVLQRLVGVRKAEYGFDPGVYCVKRTSHIWEQSLIF